MKKTKYIDTFMKRGLLNKKRASSPGRQIMLASFGKKPTSF